MNKRATAFYIPKQSVVEVANNVVHADENVTVESEKDVSVNQDAAKGNSVGDVEGNRKR